MSSRSLNQVQLIGNLTRDPELRYTPQGTAVCTLGLATNRSWTTDSGEKREETEFHRIVAWNKLAELCSQLLFKGRKVYVEGRLQTRSWTGQDGSQRQTTEVVIEEMIILDNRQAETVGEPTVSGSTPTPTPTPTPTVTETPAVDLGTVPEEPAVADLSATVPVAPKKKKEKEKMSEKPATEDTAAVTVDDLSKDMPF